MRSALGLGSAISHAIICLMPSPRQKCLSLDASRHTQRDPPQL
jgi:hypothetical protein